eukprot:975862-Pleurochrysis_carterae.AAC.1
MSSRREAAGKMHDIARKRKVAGTASRHKSSQRAAHETPQKPIGVAHLCERLRACGAVLLCHLSRSKPREMQTDRQSWIDTTAGSETETGSC